MLARGARTIAWLGCVAGMAYGTPVRAQHSGASSASPAPAPSPAPTALASTPPASPSSSKPATTSSPEPTAPSAPTAQNAPGSRVPGVPGYGTGSPQVSGGVQSGGNASMRTGQGSSGVGGSAETGGYAQANLLPISALRRVEPQVADIGPLSSSGRLPQGTSLRQPNDFVGLYQVPPEVDSPYAGWFARVRGGMIAVFPKGDYIADKDGVYPLVPPNTVYLLGGIPLRSGATSDGNSAQPSQAIDARSSTRVFSQDLGSGGAGGGRIDGRINTLVQSDRPTPVSGRVPTPLSNTPARPDSELGGVAKPTPELVAEFGVSLAELAARSTRLYTSDVYRNSRLAALAKAAGVDVAEHPRPQTAAPATPAQ